MNDFKITLTLSASETQRLDSILLQKLKEWAGKELTRARLKPLFKDRRVLFDGYPVAAAFIPSPGTHELVVLNAGELFHAKTCAPWNPSQDGPLPEILYEDAELLVLNKPAGVPSSSLGDDESKTAVGAALTLCPELQKLSFAKFEHGLLHRLDTLTSGILVFTKTEAEFNRLGQIWKSDEVAKIYRARVAASPGKVPDSWPDEIDFPIGHSAKSSKKMIAVRHPGQLSECKAPPREALTLIQEILPRDDDTFDVKLQIQTGVLHQIRCHLAAIGYPILGDPIYGGAQASRLFLQSSELILPLRSGAPLHLKAPAEF